MTILDLVEAVSAELRTTNGAVLVLGSSIRSPSRSHNIAEPGSGVRLIAA